jgi:hypothetical protein
MDTTNNDGSDEIAATFTAFSMDCSNDGFIRSLTLEFVDQHNESNMLIAMEIYRRLRSNGRAYVTISIMGRTWIE